jgi:acyl-coenzyme A thioesterase PaaI-like protein
MALADRNLIRDAWNLLSQVPGGKTVFSKLVGRAAPYTGTVDARITVLRPGYCEAQMADKKAVRNHLESIHAIALANLAEMCGNTALAYSLPDDARFIVSGMSIEYKKKARGTITAMADVPVPRSNQRASYEVPVSLRDASGEEVAHVVINSLVGPKPGKSAARAVHVN